MARDRYDDEYDDRPPRRDRDDEYDDRPPRRDRDDEYDDGPRGAPPPNYLAPAILAALFCCQITGIVAIVFAAQVNSKWAAGDRAGARQASASAKLWTWLSVGLWLALIAVYVVILVVAGAAGGGNGP